MYLGQVETSQGIFEAHRTGSRRKGYGVEIYYAYQEEGEHRVHPVMEQDGEYQLAGGGFNLNPESAVAVAGMVAHA